MPLALLRIPARKTWRGGHVIEPQAEGVTLHSWWVSVLKGAVASGTIEGRNSRWPAECHPVSPSCAGCLLVPEGSHCHFSHQRLLPGA